MRRPSSRPTVVGFVAPVVAESAERRLDLNEVVGLTEAGRLAGRYLLAVDGYVPDALSLRAGDLAVVDRTRRPRAGDLVVVERDGVLAVAPAEGEVVFGVVTHFLVEAREAGGEFLPVSSRQSEAAEGSQLGPEVIGTAAYGSSSRTERA